jgi:hypothetical protein
VQNVMLTAVVTRPRRRAPAIAGASSASGARRQRTAPHARLGLTGADADLSGLKGLTIGCARKIRSGLYFISHHLGVHMCQTAVSP